MLRLWNGRPICRFIGGCVTDLELFAVFANGEPDDEDVEDGDEQQAEGMRVGEAKGLVNREATEDKDHEGISPDFAKPERNDQDELGDSVGEKKNTGEELAFTGQIVSRSDKLASEEIRAIVNGIVMAEEANGVVGVSGSDEPSQDSTEGFEESVEGFQSKADLECAVKDSTPSGAPNVS